MTKADYFLSKSKYLAGLQCPKLLWMHYHAKDKFPPTDAGTQATFDQGHQVTEIYQTLFPGGILIDGEPGDYSGLIKKTQEALALKKPLFEPAFKFKRSFARADILKPNRDGSWDLYEVKSATSAKDIYYPDVAFQKYCYEGAGIRLRNVFLVFINNQYIKNGPIDTKALFTQEDVTEKAYELSQGVEDNINRMVSILQQKKCPNIKIGLHCDEPYECALKDMCWDFLPEENVFKLGGMHKKKAFKLIEEGTLALKDLKENYAFTPNQRVQWECHKKNKAHVRVSEVRSFIEQLEFPLYFLDFETVGPAIPVYDQSRPYQQVPFQFSLHILSGWGKEPLHHGFLAQDKNDPRPELLSQLRSLIKSKGSVLSYSMGFEIGRLRESVALYSEFAGWLKDVEKRYLDPMIIFKNFDYYDPKQMGRYSIKNVYPALTGGSYEGLEIGDGGSASREYARVMFSEGISSQDKERVLRGLEEYCKLDTQAMIDVLDVLKKAAGKKS